MDLIAIKEIGVELPQQKNIENCIKYNKTFSVSFARDGIITVVKELKADDYDTLIDYYELTEKDPILFCFQGYSANEMGNMPIVISNNHNKKFNEKTFTTNKSVIALTDSVLGVGKDNVDEFICNLFKFDKDNFSEITKLVFGDNLVAILNADGTFETYGLELTTTKRWKKSSSGIMYTDEDYVSKTSYNSNYNSYNSYNSYYYGGNYYDDYDYEYHDKNPNPYQCDVCKKKSSFVVVKGTKCLCGDCYKKENKTIGANK